MRIVEDGPGRVLLIMPDNSAFICRKTEAARAPAPAPKPERRERRGLRDFKRLMSVFNPAFIR